MILVDIDGSLAATGELLLSRYKYRFVNIQPLCLMGFGIPGRLAIYRDENQFPIALKHSTSQKTYISYSPRGLPSQGLLIRWLQKHGYPRPVYFCRTRAEKHSLLKSCSSHRR